MVRIIFIALAMVCGSAFATEPPKKIPTFGMQDCVNGVCAIPQRSFLPVVQRQRTVTRSFGLSSPVVIAAPVRVATAPLRVMQKRTVAKTRMVTKTFDVPVQKMITVMEQRTVQEPETYYEEEEYESLVCPQPQTYVPMTYNPCPCPQNYVQVTAPVQTKTVTRTRKRLGWRLRSWRSARTNTSYVYPPPGQNIYSHLQRDHGINTSGMSYNQALAMHTSLH